MAALACVMPAWFTMLGCEPYRIEYHTRPDYYKKASDRELPDRVVLDDGTVIVYNSRDLNAGVAKEAIEKADSIELREEHDDGSTTLRAFMPEHVLLHALVCLHNEEYRLLWDELIAVNTKYEYEGRGLGYEEFEKFFSTYRKDLVQTLTRMQLGLAQQDVVVENLGNSVIRYRLRSQLGSQFKFKKMDVMSEDLQMKLLLIH